MRSVFFFSFEQGRPLPDRTVGRLKIMTQLFGVWFWRQEQWLKIGAKVRVGLAPKVWVEMQERKERNLGIKICLISLLSITKKLYKPFIFFYSYIHLIFILISLFPLFLHTPHSPSFPGYFTFFSLQVLSHSPFFIFLFILPSVSVISGFLSRHSIFSRPLSLITISPTSVSSALLN